MTSRLVLVLPLAFVLTACDGSSSPSAQRGAALPNPVPAPGTPTAPPMLTPEAEPPLVCPQGLEEAVAVSAHDGDTITLEDGRRLRYIGVDAPEMAGRASEADEPGAVEARDRNRQLVVGRRLRLEFEQEREDRFGRLLAYVWIQDASGKDLMVNEVLLREGMGSVFPYSRMKRYTEVFTRAQNAARRARVGIWKEPWIGTAEYYVAYNKERFHSADCTDILNANKSKEIRFATLDEALDSGRSWCRKCRKNR